ncbi:MAG: site-specific DNA-methyltransferase, partial [Bacteroidota bacterium]
MSHINQLYYGDNYNILKEHIEDESIDLIYLDPPFNSNVNYNVFFNTASEQGSIAQTEAFQDTWNWTEEAELAYKLVFEQQNTALAELLRTLRSYLGESDMMAYLVMMAVRLVELHRVLKSTGSIYLHCDSTASHYLKILMDAVFGPENYRNEVIWKRTSSHSDGKRYGRVHDVIFFYSKSDSYTWNTQYEPYSDHYIDNYYNKQDEDGRRFMSGDLSAAGLTGGGYEYEWNGHTKVWRLPKSSMQDLEEKGYIYYTKNGIARRKRYLDESKGLACSDTWTDIEALRSWHKERLGYPTQKPLALLERLISASSNEGDVVLDPFCGCGTALHAAEKLNRNWLGIDITH